MLLPEAGGGREQAMSWLFWSMSGVGPTFGQLMHFVSAEDGSSFAVRRFVGKAVRLLHVLERRLGNAAYFAEEYSIADVAAFTWVNFGCDDQEQRRQCTRRHASGRWMAHRDQQPPRGPARATSAQDRHRQGEADYLALPGRLRPPGPRGAWVQGRLVASRGPRDPDRRVIGS